MIQSARYIQTKPSEGMTQEAKVDTEFLARVIQAPWLPHQSQRERQRGSELLRRNASAMIQQLNTIGDSSIMVPEQFQFMNDSGLLDYISTYQDLSFNEGQEFTYSVIVINGQVYYVLRKGVESMITVKFFKIPGTMPFVFRWTPEGYDFLLPANYSAELLSDVMRNKYEHVFSKVDSKMVYKSGDAKSYVKSIGLDEVINDPLAKMAAELYNSGIASYEIIMNLYVVTDTVTGHQRVFALPKNEYGSINDTIYELCNQILPIESLQGDDSLAFYIMKFVAGVLDIKRGDGELINSQRRVTQYSMPEVKAGEGRIAWDIMDSETEDGRNYTYLDMLMCLSSKGILSNLVNSGRKDYLKFFTENLDASMPYARYGFDAFVPYYADPEVMLSGMDDYQEHYNMAVEAHTRVDEKHGVGTFIEPVDATYVPRNPERRDRLWEIVNKRIEAVFREMGVDLSSNPVWVIEDFLAGKRILVGSDRSFSNVLPEETVRYIPVLERLIEYKKSIRVVGEGDPDILVPVEPISTHFTIHGVMFKSDEVVRLFHNTPIASAAAFTNEYDPPFMSHKDVRLAADLLSGRIMVYTYLLELSNEAFTALSDKDTFIFLSQFSTHYLDQVFVLGDRMVNNLPRVREIRNYGITGSFSMDKQTRTLITMF